jgi:hypothetical protein
LPHGTTQIPDGKKKKTLRLTIGQKKRKIISFFFKQDVQLCPLNVGSCNYSLLINKETIFIKILQCCGISLIAKLFFINSIAFFF